MAERTWHRLDGDGFVCFRSAGHVSASVLRALYENGTGFDVELFGTAAAGENPDTLQPIRAHKMILMHASKHLHELFTVDGYLDSHQTQYKLTEISHESLSDIVKFTYIDELNVRAELASERMQKVLTGAKFLVMTDLATACETYLASDIHLNLQNCMSMLRFARKYVCLSLLDAVLHLAARNLPYFIDKPEFLALNEGEISKLLLSEPVVTLADADERCQAAIAWLSHDRPARDACISDILNMVPFNLSTISIATLGVAGSNAAIRAKYAEKFMDAIFDSAKNYQPGFSTKRVVSDVWWNACNRRADTWYVIGGATAGTEFVTYDVTRRYWSKLPNLPWTRAHAGACVLGFGTIFLFGGHKNNQISADIDQYNLSANTWTTNPTKLGAANACSSVCVSMHRRTERIAHEQSVFILGGYPADRHDKMENFRVREVNGKVSGGLEKMPKMPVGRYNFAAACTGNAFFIAGGNRHDLGNARLSSIEKYDCVANKWSTIGNLKRGGRSLSQAAVLGDDLYLAGGFDGIGGVDTVEILNIRAGQIRQAPGLLGTRCSGSGVALDRNTFCVVGGCMNGGESACLRSVECFDIREGRWSTGVIVPDMPTPNRNFGFACV